MIANGVRNGKVIIAWRGHITILYQRIVQMSVETVFHFTNIFYLHNAAHTDLLAFVTVRFWRRHDAPQTGLVYVDGEVEANLASANLQLMEQTKWWNRANEYENILLAHSH